MKRNKKELQAELMILKDVAEKRQWMPILSNVLIDARGNMATTDLETQVIFGSESPTVGVCVNAIDFYNAVKNSAASEIELTIDTESKTLQVGGMKLVGDNWQDFPSSMKTEDGCIASFVASELARIIPFASTDETRYNINGVFIDGEKGRLAATDGHRLAIASTEIGEKSIKRILPTKSAKVISKIAKLYKEESASLAIGESFVTYQLSYKNKRRVQLICRPVDGQYPDIDRVLPGSVNSKPTTTIASDLDIKQFAVVAKQAMTVCTGKVKTLKLSFADNKLTIKGSSPEKGEFCDSFNGFELQGEPLDIGIAGVYLLEMLKSDVHSIEMSEKLSPINFYNRDRNLLGVIMPIKFD